MTAINGFLRRIKAVRDGASDGFTIVELMVSIILLAVISTTFLAATNAIYGGIHKQQGITDAADGNRRVFETLDKQVRYASAINTPGTGTDGNFYIEYQWSKSTGSLDAVTCTQWRVNPTTDVMQTRSWASGTTPNPVPTWTTVDTGVTNTTTPFALLGPTLNGATMQYQVLSLNLISTRDKGNVTTTGQFTALNTPNNNAPSPSVCQGVPRS